MLHARVVDHLLEMTWSLLLKGSLVHLHQVSEGINLAILTYFHTLFPGIITHVCSWLVSKFRLNFIPIMSISCK